MVFVKVSALPALLFAVSSIAVPVPFEDAIDDTFLNVGVNKGNNNINTNINGNTNTNTYSNLNFSRDQIGHCFYNPSGVLLPISYNAATPVTLPATLGTRVEAVKGVLDDTIDLDTLDKHSKSQNINQNINGNKNLNADFHDDFGHFGHFAFGDFGPFGFDSFKRDESSADLNKRDPRGKNHNINLNGNINSKSHHHLGHDFDHDFDHGFGHGFGHGFKDKFGKGRKGGNRNVNINRNGNANINGHRHKHGFGGDGSGFFKRDSSPAPQNLNWGDGVAEVDGIDVDVAVGDEATLVARTEADNAEQAEEIPTAEDILVVEKRRVGSLNRQHGNGQSNNNQPNNINIVGSHGKKNHRGGFGNFGSIIKGGDPHHKHTPHHKHAPHHRHHHHHKQEHKDGHWAHDKIKRQNNNINNNINANANINTNLQKGIVVCGYNAQKNVFERLEWGVGQKFWG